ncbi:MAG: hypothetical protein KGL39_52515 [Patescibacteria group bacterium]|nr:hypothetical protein [Patescibacteria group bacterium]
MELTAYQLDQIRARQLEDEAVTRLNSRSIVSGYSQEDIARAARDAIIEVRQELSNRKYTAGTSIRA